MAALPTNVGTGIVRVKVRRIGLVEGSPPDSVPLTGKIVFTPSVPMLRHVDSGEVYMAYSQSAYLEDGDAVVELVATNDPDLSPINYTYTVNLILDEELVVVPFSIQVLEGTDVELATIVPFEDNTGTFYLQGPPGAVDPQAVSDVLGVHLVTSATPPTYTTYAGNPVVWIADGSTLTNVPVVPTAPSWNFTSFTVTPPSLVGVQYEIVDGSNYVPIPGGTATSLAGFTRPFVATVRAVAKPGYVLLSAYQWSQLFYDSASLALWASDGFAGTAGTQLAPANNVAGRTWDMVPGGTATGGAIPKWFSHHATIPAGWKLDATGTKAVRSDLAGTDSTNGFVNVDVGAPNHRVEIDVTAFPIRHSREVSISVGASSNGAVGANVAIYIDSTSARIRWGASGGVANEDFAYKGSGVTEANMLGTYKVTWVNEVVRVDCPDGQTFSRDCSPSSSVFGNHVQLKWADFGTAPTIAPTVDAIRVYK